MKIRITVLPSSHGRRINWRIEFPNGHEITILGRDENYLEDVRANQLRNTGKSNIITQARLMEEFGAILKAVLKREGDTISFDDCGFFSKIREEE